MTSEITLDEWLDDVAEDRPQAIDCSFPNEALRNKYISTIEQYTTDEISDLLRNFLLQSGSLGVDKSHLEYFQAASISNETEYRRRLFLYEGAKKLGFEEVPPPWEGITWILDLLPDQPRAAIATLEAYLHAHFYVLPDGRIAGLFDAMEVIRAKYIERPRSDADALRLLRHESPRTLEHLVERIYAAMGYNTTLTAWQKDGGYDVLATKEAAGQRARLHIECKNWEANVGVRVMRGLLGVIADSGATNGICATTSDLTKEAKDFAKRNPRLDFISGSALVRHMNEYLGPTWFYRIERLVSESQNAQGQQSGAASGIMAIEETTDVSD